MKETVEPGVNTMGSTKNRAFPVMLLAVVSLLLLAGCSPSKPAPPVVARPRFYEFYSPF